MTARTWSSQRLDGPTLGDAAIAGDLSATELGEIHADLHRRLQAIPAPSGTPGLVVVHGDLHPLNVIATADGPVVIDWRNALEGTAEFDVAMTAIIFAQVALDPSFEALTPLLREALATYLANSIDPTPGLPDALAERGRNITLTAEELALLPAQDALIRSYSGVRTGQRWAETGNTCPETHRRVFKPQALRNWDGVRGRVTMRSSPMWPAKACSMMLS